MFNCSSSLFKHCALCSCIVNMAKAEDDVSEYQSQCEKKYSAFLFMKITFAREKKIGRLNAR